MKPILLRDNIYFTLFEHRGKTRRRYWVSSLCSHCGKKILVDRTNFKKSKKSFCDLGCKSSGSRGPLSSNWTGGRKQKSGEKSYILIYAPEHPFARKGYVPEHRLVMEKKLGRILTPEELVHHIDCHKQHNNVDNLDVCSLSEHNQAHASFEKLVAELMDMGVVKYDREAKKYFVVRTSPSK